MIMNQLVGLLVRITGIHSIMTMSIKKSYTQGVDHSSNQNNAWPQQRVTIHAVVPKSNELH